MESNSHKCPLSNTCKLAGKLPECNSQCMPFITIQSRFNSANIPKEYQDIFLDNSPAKEGQSDVYNSLTSYVKTFSSGDIRVKSLYLFSTSPGTGKTTTSCALLNEYIRHRFLYYVRNGENIPSRIGLFVDINDLQRRYNLATMASDQNEIKAIKDELKEMTTVEFAVLDDIGVRKDVSESFRSLVHSVVNARLTEHRPTIYTSNLPISDMKKVFDERLGDRIADMTAGITFKGTSRRGVR